MSGNGKNKAKRHDSMQVELNRLALVDIGKRLAELEKKFWDLEREAEDLRYFATNTLGTAKRLQGLAAQIVGTRQMRPTSKTPPPTPPARTSPTRPPMTRLAMAKIDRTKRKPER